MLRFYKINSSDFSNFLEDLDEDSFYLVESEQDKKLFLGNYLVNQLTIQQNDLGGYKFFQSGKLVGEINIPKDMVVKSGSVVDNPTGKEPGKYVELVLANAKPGSDKIYINVQDLVDVYTSEKNATKIQVNISNTNKISANIVPGSISTADLSSNAVETGKIKDGAVTLSKLGTDVTEKLDLLEWGTF